MQALAPSTSRPAYLCLSDLRRSAQYKYWALAVIATSLLYGSLYPFPERIGTPSSQQPASGFLQIRGRPRHPCLRLTPSLAGYFHLQVTSLTTTAKLVALTHNAPCLAHQQKAPADSRQQGLLFLGYHQITLAEPLNFGRKGK